MPRESSGSPSGCCCSAAPGCGPSRPETVRVSGVVTIDGKAPAGPGLLYFHPIEAAKGFPTRPGNGAFDTTGRYTVKSFVEGDGLMPGRYQVSVECWESPPDMAGPPAKSRIAARYQSARSSGVEEVLIEPGSSPREINFDLSSR